MVALACVISIWASPMMPISPTELAAVAYGEAGGAAVWGSDERALEVGRWVMWVARNRGSLRGFYGWRDPPLAWVRAAERVLAAKSGRDPTGGQRYVLSRQDVAKLGVQPGIIWEGRHPAFGLHFYAHWPLDSP